MYAYRRLGKVLANYSIAAIATGSILSWTLLLAVDLPIYLYFVAALPVGPALYLLYRFSRAENFEPKIEMSAALAAAFLTPLVTVPVSILIWVYGLAEE